MASAPESRRPYVFWMPGFSRSREAFAALLRRTRTLYSFDACSAVLDEASACGCRVKVVTQTGLKDFVSSADRVEAEFPAQFDRFVTLTQSLRYTGRMQSVFLWDYWFYAIWRVYLKPLVTHIRLSCK